MKYCINNRNRTKIIWYAFNKIASVSDFDNITNINYGIIFMNKNRAIE